MPPSPALRFSPGREPRTDGHKRGRSLESGLLFREKDDDLALFNEMQTREKESFLLQSTDDLEDSFSTKLRHISDVNLGISISGRGETSDLLNDGDKNDYDWLLTPPDTPLFPSLDDEPPLTSFGSRGRPQSKPISISRSSTMDKSYRSSRGSASPNRLSSSPRSGANTLQSRGRSSSVPNSSPTPSVRYATPSRRPSPPPSKPMTPASKYSTYTPRRMSTGSSGSAVSAGVRGTSPVKTNRGNSASPKIRAWQTNIPGFSSEAPPNLRTSLADRPASYVRGSSPASRNGRDSTSKFSRQSMSPTASRSSSSFHSHDRDQLSSRSKGSIASSGDDDVDSLQSITVGSLDRLSSKRGGSFSTNRTPAISKKSGRIVSPSSAPKRSFDLAIRQMDRKTPQNMFRPLLSSVPSTTFYAGKANSAHRSLVSRNSSVTTSSNASSDQGTTFALDTEGSDHNQDDMASEADKILYPDIHEEVFVFDKIDALNVNIKQEINRESVDILHNEIRDPKTVSGSIESEDSISHIHIDTRVNESLEISHVRGDISETGNFENTALCSHCGNCYEVYNQAEKNIGLCQECSRKTTLLRVVIPDTTVAVSEDPSLITTNMPKEEKSLPETNQLMVSSDLPQETNVGNLRFPHGEQDAEESQTSCSGVNQDHSQNSPRPNSLAEVGRQTSGNLLEMNQIGVDNKKRDNELGDQPHCSDNPNSNLDPIEGTGISVLLKRSSSNKGPVVQGRTFTATTISYDDLSLARDSISSFRSSTRPGSYSASSSIDLSSTRQTEFRVQRQLSGRKLDVDSGSDLRVKPPSTASSFSGASNHSRHELGLATQEVAGTTECGFVEVRQVLQEMQASGNTVKDVIDASSIDLAVEEDIFECDDCSRVNNACSTEFLSQATDVQSDDNLVTSFQNHGDCISHENVDGHPNNARDVSDTETSPIASELSSYEKHDMQFQNSTVNELDALVTTNCSTISESEIERENDCEINISMVKDDLSKSALDDFREPSAQNPSNSCQATSVSEFGVSESHHIEGSTVTVECQGVGNTRSLTLEEATDAILFCSSIVHDLAYQAATIAMEKECSDDPFEGSEPTVTLLGKANSDRKDSRSRPVSKRTLKSKKTKTKQRRVESDVKTPSGKTENDENIDESFTHNVGLPNKVDSMKPPKLESKCNCIIM